MVVIACGVWSDVVCFRLFGGMMIFILVIFLFLVCIGVDDTTADFSNWDKDSTTLYSATGDCLPPVVNTQDITVQLDAKGVASISAAAIDNGSYDNATPTKNLVFSVDKTTFNCSDLGVNEVGEKGKKGIKK